MVKNLGLIPL